MVELSIQLPEGFLKEETRCGYTISEEMKTLWAVQLDLTVQLFRICEKHGIRLYLSSGTILGAARHQGFIPWDDDIDLTMTREEFDKLCEVAPKELKYPYFFQTEQTDPGSLRGHGQIRRSDTTCILKEELAGKYGFNQGIFVDIFPLDNIPDDAAERREFLDQLQYLQRKAIVWAYRSINYVPGHSSGIKERIQNVLYPFFGWVVRTFRIANPWYRKFEQLCRKYNDRPTENVSMLVISYDSERFIWNREKLLSGEPVMMPFESFTFPVPYGWEHYLEISFGDWHEFVIGTSLHGGLIIDGDKPYTEYLK